MTTDRNPNKTTQFGASHNGSLFQSEWAKKKGTDFGESRYTQSRRPSARNLKVLAFAIAFCSALVAVTWAAFESIPYNWLILGSLVTVTVIFTIQLVMVWETYRKESLYFQARSRYDLDNQDVLSG